MKIAVVGTGYVGLVLGACLAENGNNVICVDKDESKIDMLEAGKMPIYEPGLEEMVRRNHARGAPDVHDRPAGRGARRRISSSSPSARRRARTARPTCSTCSAWRATIGRAMNKYTVVVDKSTVPVGTAKKVRAAIADGDDAAVQRRQQPGIPQAGRGDRRLHEARSRGDRRRDDDERPATLMKELYGPFTRTGAPIMMMDTASAELCKYAANSILATRISFMNEIANVCELVGADVDQVRKAIGSDRRIGIVVPVSRASATAAAAFRRTCKALLKSAADKGYDFKILRAVEDGERRAEDAARRARWKRTSATCTGRTIALWGLAFKPRTDDMREAPAIPIIERLLERGRDGARVRSGGGADGARASSATASRSARRATTRWPAPTRWRSSPSGTSSASRTSRRCAQLLKAPVVFDGRNIYSPEHMRALGFTYFSIGR